MRPERVIDPDGYAVDVFLLPTDEASLEELLRDLFERRWDEIVFGPIVEGAAWEMRATRRNGSAILIGAVLLRSLDHLVGNRDGEPAARDDVAAVVNAGPDTGLRGPLTERREPLGVARKEVAEHSGDRD